MTKSIQYLRGVILISGLMWAGVSTASEAGFCPRLEGKRAGVCRADQPGSGCVPDEPCAPAPILLCEEESSFEMPILNGGTCVASEKRCTVVGEDRTCEQVCTKWEPATCTVQTAECCRRYKIIGEQKMKCCNNSCSPVGESGICGSGPTPPSAKKLPICGADGRC